MEGNIECGTGNNKCLCKVGGINKVVLQLAHSATVLLQRNHLWHTFLLSLKNGLYAQQTKDVTCGRVALHRAVHESRKVHFGIAIFTQSYHLVPIAGSAPVALDKVRAMIIGFVGYGDGIGRTPFCLGTKLVHHPQREVDIRTRDDVARELKCESLFQHRTNHKQGRNVLRAYVARNLQLSASKLLAGDFQWWETFFAYVFYLCSQSAQGINQNGYRTVLHALGSGNHVGSAHNTQVGRHESHGGSCSLNVDNLGHVSKCIDYYLGIIAIAKVLRHLSASAQSVDDKGTV